MPNPKRARYRFMAALGVFAILVAIVRPEQIPEIFIPVLAVVGTVLLLLAFYDAVDWSRWRSLKEWCQEWLWAGAPAHKEGEPNETSGTQTDFPDWPIRELFLYIDSNVCLQGRIRWETIGQEIKDKLAYGILTAWGRPLAIGTEADQESDEALSSPEKIAQAYWSEAEFTYNFFDVSERFNKHVEPPPHTSFKPYADLTFCEKEANSIEWQTKRPAWPDFEKLDQKNYFKLYEAACYCLEYPEASYPMPSDAEQLYNCWRDEWLEGTPDRLRVLLKAEEAAQSALDRAYRGYDQTFHPEMEVSREALIEWCNIKGLRPRFLFKDRRGVS